MSEQANHSFHEHCVFSVEGSNVGFFVFAREESQGVVPVDRFFFFSFLSWPARTTSNNTVFHFGEILIYGDFVMV